MPENNHTQRQLELESQLAQLQRHVEQQDQEMFSMSERMRKVEAELKSARQRLKDMQEGQGNLPHERPPHY